jgi:UDP-N-acetylmuramate dehydrogenase
MAQCFVAPKTEAELANALAEVDARGEPVLILGGGSNLVVADAAFEGTVVYLGAGLNSLHIKSDADLVRMQVGAGFSWDGFVAEAVARGAVGVECLSGIPGLVGGAPIQNIGAYGQEVESTLTSVRAYDRETRAFVTFQNHECEFAYRHSRFKHQSRFVVTEVQFALPRGSMSAPITYAELVRDLGVAHGGSAPLAKVRERVIALRRGKGMVLDPSDVDTRSAGSFFTNPIVPNAELDTVVARIRAHVGDAHIPMFPTGTASTKLAAAWLIERAGFHKGQQRGGIRISQKHALALVNCGVDARAGTGEELLALALQIRDGVHARFGVELVPEPVFVGMVWPNIVRQN